MSVLQDVAGAMFGGVASAIVGALESLCRERERAKHRQLSVCACAIFRL